jgi:hypothetical protein
VSLDVWSMVLLYYSINVGDFTLPLSFSQELDLTTSASVVQQHGANDSRIDVQPVTLTNRAEQSHRR